MTAVNPSDAQAAGDAPVGWAKLVDPWAGFSLAHPPGWSGHNDCGMIVVSEDQSNTAAAWIAAAPLAGAANLQDFATRYVAAVHTGDPSFEAAPGPISAPGSLLLRTHCRRGNVALEGRINMVARGDQVVIRGFQVPAGGSGGDAPPRAAEMLASCAFTAQSDARGLTKVCVPGSYWTLYDKWLVGTRFMPAGEIRRRMVAEEAPDEGPAHRDVGGLARAAAASAGGGRRPRHGSAQRRDHCGAHHRHLHARRHAGARADVHRDGAQAQRRRERSAERSGVRAFAVLLPCPGRRARRA